MKNIISIVYYNPSRKAIIALMWDFLLTSFTEIFYNTYKIHIKTIFL